MDSLPKLSILDDIHIWPEEREHFHGLARQPGEPVLTCDPGVQFALWLSSVTAVQAQEQPIPVPALPQLFFPDTIWFQAMGFPPQLWQEEHLYRGRC